MSHDVEKEQAAIADALRLRGPAPPVTRISRKALVVVGGLLSAGLAGALAWSTLERPAKVAPQPPAASATQAPQKIAALPRDYLRRGPPPPLGPPLPGDLGRPILSAQAARGADPLSHRGQGFEPPARADRGSVGGPGRGGDPGTASGLFFPGVAAAQTVSSAPTPPPVQADPRTTSPERLQSPASPYVLQAGAIIPAALITGLRSDVPGVAIAQVTQDVHDSLTGRHLLIPAGSRLVGDYGAAATVGQSRLALVWTRLILPSGRSMVLDKLPAADPQGMAGLQDGVDRHWRQVWSAAALSTVLAIAAETQDADAGDLARAIRRGTSQAVTDVGRQAVGRDLALTPTLTVRPGAPLRVLLTRDLVLEPYPTEVTR